MSDLQALAAFVRVRLDEEEQVTRAATPGPWHPNFDDQEVVAVHDITVAECSRLGERQLWANLDHIAYQNPARVLAGVEAKREVVRLAEHAHDYAPTFTNGFGSAMEHALRLFAVAHASHPDYREAWRP